MNVKFDHEKLDVYQLELRFIEWVMPLLDEVRDLTKPRARDVTDQLDRASLSSLLNTAEGNGRRQRQTRAKFFDDARGSATECAARLDASVAKRIVAPERIDSGKEILVRTVSILRRLVEQFDTESSLHDKEGPVSGMTVFHDERPVGRPEQPRTRTRRRTFRTD